MNKILISFIFFLLLCQKGFAQNENDTSSIDEAIFSTNDKYFPDLLLQYSKPFFIWDDFNIYNQKLWGDDQGSNVLIVKRIMHFYQNGKKSSRRMQR